MISFEELEQSYDPEESASLKFAPITLCDVERSFSIHKSILNDKRYAFFFENLKMIFIINCNSSNF